jgi:hypothetical protein
MSKEDKEDHPLHRMHEGVEHIDHVTFGKRTDDEMGRPKGGFKEPQNSKGFLY